MGFKKKVRKKKIEERLVKIYMNKCQLPQKGLGHETPDTDLQTKRTSTGFLILKKTPNLSISLKIRLLYSQIIILVS